MLEDCDISSWADNLVTTLECRTVNARNGHQPHSDS